MSKLTTFFSIVLIILFALSFVSAQNTPPPPPTNLTLWPTNMGLELRWQWQQPSITNVQFKVYKAVDTNPFLNIATVQHLHFLDRAVQPGHVYKYYVTAFINGLESGPSNIVSTPSIIVPGIKGFIAGTIIDDTTGLPIPGVRVRFFKSNGNIFFREAYTNNQGNYFAPVDTGSLFVFATKWTYRPEWFDNKPSRIVADPVVIVLGDTAVANFGLTKISPPPPPTLVSVSGTVIDSMTNAPIANAMVAIIRNNRQVSTMQNYQGSMFFGMPDETVTIPGVGLMHGVVRAVKTDTNGNYTAQVPAGLTYIILASKAGYIPEFYQNKRTPFTADRLTITGDTSGINFDLVINPAVQNSLSGKVKNSDNDGVPSRVVLFHKTPRGMHPVRYVVTDSLGNYIFNYIFVGTYYAKAVPFANYAPAWYDVDSCGIIRWINADTIAVSGNVTGADICVLPLNTPGFAKISGKIFSQTQNNVIQGVTVYAVSQTNNTISSFDITEYDGTFNIENLATGSYKIIVDKEGYTSTTTPVFEVGQFNNYTVNNVLLNITDATLSVGDRDNKIPSTYFLEQNYPNPFNPSTEISFGIPTKSNVNIAVYNILGQHMVTIYSGELSAGNHSITWNGVDESGRFVGSGVYFYKITANSVENATNFSSVKKMMLVK